VSGDINPMLVYHRLSTRNVHVGYILGIIDLQAYTMVVCAVKHP